MVIEEVFLKSGSTLDERCPVEQVCPLLVHSKRFGKVLLAEVDKNSIGDVVRTGQVNWCPVKNEGARVSLAKHLYCLKWECRHSGRW